MPVRLLRERLNSLPLVFAGPMLRRAEPGGVTVWVALTVALPHGGRGGRRGRERGDPHRRRG